MDTVSCIMPCTNPRQIVFHATLDSNTDHTATRTPSNVFTEESKGNLTASRKSGKARYRAKVSTRLGVSSWWVDTGDALHADVDSVIAWPTKQRRLCRPVQCLLHTIPNALSLRGDSKPGTVPRSRCDVWRSTVCAAPADLRCCSVQSPRAEPADRPAGVRPPADLPLCNGCGTASSVGGWWGR